MTQSNPAFCTYHPCATRLRSILFFLAVAAITIFTLFQEGGRIVEADTSIGNVPAGTFPFAIAVNPVTNKVSVANRDSANVTVIDGANNQITTVPVGSLGPQAIAKNPLTNKIYVANSNNNVTVIDGADNSTTLIPTGTVAQAIVVNPITNKIYVANQVSGTVTVIDGTNNSTTTVAAGNNPFAIALNPVTNKIWSCTNNQQISAEAFGLSTDIPIPYPITP